MLNFEFHNPTKIVFGKKTISKLPKLIPAGAKVMIVYGGGSIKKNGIYEQVTAALKDYDFIEFGGIEPNPEYETCLKAINLAKENNISFLLAVGGGSVIDATKFIASGFFFEDGEPWDIIAKASPLEKALPLGCVLTLPATGSEMNRNSVISRRAKNEKMAFRNDISFPKFSILDPEATFSLPETQTVNGIVDAFIHVVEQYITYDVNSPLQDRQAEAVLATLIEEAPKVINNPKDYDARANIMWCATTALNHSLACGNVGDWATHGIGHGLTITFGLDHGKALAVILPSLWRYQFECKKQKLAQMGRRVYGITSSDDEYTARETIRKTEEFFNSIGMPTKLKHYGITFEQCKHIPETFTEKKIFLGEKQNLGEKEIAEIIQGAIE
ncbi:MAG: iron-containing alcohol dehydrogenase [Alphaproteobacteria bacterium]